jgi:hypothetical protein
MYAFNNYIVAARLFIELGIDVVPQVTTSGSHFLYLPALVNTNVTDAGSRAVE